MEQSKLFDRPAFHLALVALLGLLAYSNTFAAPFQWDESFFIADNPVVKDLGYFLTPSKADGLQQYEALRTRYVGFLTFALNYKLHGLELAGYHAANVAIHILNSLLVYFLVALTFGTPFLLASGLNKHSLHIALFTALFFVAHPVQTEAVTYVFQRLASLAAFFYLLSLVAYIGSRLSEAKARKYGLYALSLASAVLAMKTKENAFTLPFVVALYEVFFFSGPVRARSLRLVPFLLSLLIIPLSLAGAERPAGEVISGLSSVPRGFEEFTRPEYLFTQFRVVVTYMRLLIFPINQNIDYDYPTFGSLFDPQSMMAFLFLAAVLSLGIYLAVRSRTGEPALRLLSLCILWFFINLSVESSIIPIPMLVNEYRIYLPSVGFFAAFSVGAFYLYGKIGRKTARIAVVVFLCLWPALLATATYARNATWKSYIGLWSDVVKKSPQKERGHYNLGRAYQFDGALDEAIKQYQAAIDIKPDYARAHNNLGMAYRSKGLLDKAIEHYEIALRLEPENAEIRNNLANAYDVRGEADKAIEHYKEAIRLKPEYAVAHYNLGIVYYRQGMPAEARAEFERVLEIDPGFNQARLALQEMD